MLNDNKLTGDIPKGLGKLKNLELLWVDININTITISLITYYWLFNIRWLENNEFESTSKLPEELYKFVDNR